MEAVILRRKMPIKKRVSGIALFITALLVTAVIFFPFVYMMLMSLKPTSQSIFVWPPSLVSLPLQFSNYAEAFRLMNFLRSFKNTMIILVCGGGLQITTSVLIAYGFSRFRCRESNAWFSLMLSTMMLPWIVTLAPRYVMFSYFGWLGTLLPLIAPSIGGSAFNVFMLVQFIRGIPKDLDEAAIIDGCSRFRVLVQILLPNLIPIVSTMIIFAVTSAWGDYTGPSIYLTNPKLYTLALSFDNFRTVTNTVEWNLAMAGSVLYALPVLLIFFCFQSAFIKGITIGGVKE